MKNTNDPGRRKAQGTHGKQNHATLTELPSVVTAVGAGVGGLYLSTQSVVVTVIGAVLAAVLTLPTVIAKKPR